MVVDHCLRKGSAVEAEHAIAVLEVLGLPWRLLRLAWTDGRPRRGKVLEAARAQRYAALTECCRENHCSTLLTGHHAGMKTQARSCLTIDFPLLVLLLNWTGLVTGDQVEHFVIRVSRGSGIEGLAGIPAISYLSGAPASNVSFSTS